MLTVCVHVRNTLVCTLAGADGPGPSDLARVWWPSSVFLSLVTNGGSNLEH